MTEVLYNPKIKPEHLARKAIVYLRQSSEKQVRQNKESQLLQYAVAERVRALGWVCQIFGTLIADEQQVYDLNYLDDQLVLGIKGTLSVVELKVLRQRLQAGQESKARRGELLKRLPVGYAGDAMGKVALHPDRRVCEAMQLVFAKFRERWSVRQTFQWFRDHDVELPTNPIQGTQLVWKTPSQSLIRDILCNPFYAGV